MNILLFDAEELADAGRVTVRGRRFEHLRRVLKVTEGQRLRAGIVRGAEGNATVHRVIEDAIELRFEAISSPAEPTLSVVIAVPRPKALSRMVQAAASFHLRRIEIINAWRVDASYFKSHKLEPDALAFEARLGCEQGGITYVPEVTVHRYFAPYIDEVLAPRRAVERDELLVGHPSEPEWPSVGLEAVLLASSAEALTLVLGPDGGFVDKELESLTAVGGKLVGFSDTVLRSETALVAGLSQIALLRRLSSRVQSVNLGV